MDYLFLHTGFPNQWQHLARSLAAEPGNRVVLATAAAHARVPGVEIVQLRPHRDVSLRTHHYSRGLEMAVLTGQAAWRALAPLKQDGFAPAIVGAHAGWGTGLFMRDLFPDARLLGYFEWFYDGHGPTSEAVNDRPPSEDDRMFLRMKNAPIVQDMVNSHRGLAPTRFQRDQFPALYRPHLSVIHDGIDTALFAPAAEARPSLRLPGLDLSSAGEILTYVCRGMEPMRGFPQLMRALARLQQRRPRLHAVIVGGEAVVYGRALPDGRSYRQKMLAELPLDAERLHFTGPLPYDAYRACLRAGDVHVYLSRPYVLSWSLLESMSLGALVVGADCTPVREVMRDEVNGLLADMEDPDILAARIEAALERPDRGRDLREAARETITRHYDLRDCLAARRRLLQTMLEGD